MPPPATMRFVASSLVRPDFPATLRQCILATSSTPSRRCYASVPSQTRIKREIDKVARIDAQKTDTESMSEMQTRANNEYFKAGGGPLVPGQSYLPSCLQTTLVVTAEALCVDEADPVAAKQAPSSPYPYPDTHAPRFSSSATNGTGHDNGV